MNIDFISTPSPVESNATPPVEPSSTEAADGDAGSFAALLDLAAQDPGAQAFVGEDDDETMSFDEWATVAMTMPFVLPVIPQDVAPAVSEGVAASEATAVESVAADSSGTPGPVEAAAVDAVPVQSATPSAWSAAPAVDEGVVPSTDGAEPDASQPIAKAAVEPVAPHAQQASDTEALEKTIMRAEPVVVDPVTSTSTDSTTQASNEPVARSDKAVAPATAAAKKVKVEPPAAVVADAPPPEASHAPEESHWRASSPDGSVRQEDSVATAKGVAARLARALERAAEPVAAQAHPSAGDEDAGSFTPGGDGQKQAFGDWLRDQIAASGTGSQRAQAAPPTFSLSVPSPSDPRIAQVLATPGAEATAGAPALPGEHDVNAQLIQSLRIQFRDGIGEAVLKLKPEQLGAVSISLRVENGGLKATVQADVPAVRQWIESQQDTLRSALAGHGLRLDQFVVDPEGQRESSADDTREEQSRKRQQQRRSVQEDQPVFEVVV